MMEDPCHAVVDVGTNSVKLLIAAVRESTLQPLLEESTQTRLGSGFYPDHRLQPSAIVETADAVARYVAMAQRWQPKTIRILATSAARDAVNQGELAKAIESASGRTVDILSGAREAHLAFQGVATDSRLHGHPLLLLDVGGGSTEFILGEGSVQVFRESYQLGTVRLTEHLKPKDPPTQEDWQHCDAGLFQFLDEMIRPSLEPLLEGLPLRPRLVGTGGTTTILARIQLGLSTYDRDRLDGCVLTRADVVETRRRLWSVPLEERRQIRGLPADRADIMLAGAAIFEAVMRQFQFAELTSSMRGLRYAAILEASRA